MHATIELVRRRLRALRRNDDGITLIELLVAMMLLSILLVVISSLYISSMNAVALSREVTGNTKQISNAMNEATRVIRAGTENPLAPPSTAAPAFVTAKKDDIVMYAYINLTSSEEKPQMIRLWVDRTTGKFMESRWPATKVTGTTRWTFPSNPCMGTNTPAGCTAPTSRLELASTVPGSASVVFRYYKKNGDPITVPSNGLLEVDRKLVSSVKVTLTVQTSLTDNSNPVTVESTVGMPNLGFAEES